ncbi:hypothetical protein ACFIOY_25860 [Bradyrhizobium sp. TZ2]
MTPLQFHRALEHMDVWSASSDGFSFVISYESPTGPGFHGRAGYLASWRPLHLNSLAIKISGSPFETFAKAEEACNAMLDVLIKQNDGGPHDELSSAPQSESQLLILEAVSRDPSPA